MKYSKNLDHQTQLLDIALGPQIGFDGAYFEPDTNCWLMTNRCYDTTTEQFISVDPSLLLLNQPYSYAGTIPSFSDPTEPYRFTYGDPANLSDINGLQPEGSGPYGSEVGRSLPKPSSNVLAPTNDPQLPPTDIPLGWRVRFMDSLNSIRIVIG